MKIFEFYDNTLDTILDCEDPADLPKLELLGEALERLSFRLLSQTAAIKANLELPKRRGPKPGTKRTVTEQENYNSPGVYNNTPDPDYVPA